MRLLTIDEANREVAGSACGLAMRLAIPRVRLARLLTGRGSLAELTPGDRHAIADYWALLDELEQLGLGDLVVAQLDGILSVVRDPDTELGVLSDFANINDDGDMEIVTAA